MEKTTNSFMNVCVVTVTYNRKEYLCKLLNSLSSQTYPIDTIYIFDNHSDDGTMEILFQQGIIFDREISQNEFYGLWNGIRINYHYNDVNAGGAGGFEEVFKIASLNNHDLLWAMDDDVLPEKNCLEILLSKMDNEHKITVPSRTDNEFTDYFITSYNLTNPFIFSIGLLCTKEYSTNLNKECTDICAFPLEGPLFCMEIIKKVGYPDSSYFILFDDTDYARRCIAYTKIRYVASACLHKQIIPPNINKFSWKDYYGYRNCFLFDMKYGKNVGVRKLRPFFIMMATYLMKKYVRHDKKIANTVKVAYKDAIKGRKGKTVEPGKLEEYLNDYQ